MVSSIPGSNILNIILDVIAQSLQIPVIIFLIIFAIVSIILLGGLISEHTSRKKIPINQLEELILKISNSTSNEEIKELLNTTDIPKSQREILIKVTDSNLPDKESREILARKLLENEENKLDKQLEKSDVITRIGPTLGLMGTLIPMGPGLAALGSGDIITLSQSIIIAFNTTIVGIGAGALSYFVSKIRRRWYEEYISNLDALLDIILNTFN